MQGGDECNRGALATYTTVDDALRVTVVPVQWNPDWDQQGCQQSACTGPARPAQIKYVMDLRFVNAHVVEITNEVQSSEAFDHAPTTQEFPTLYVAHRSGGPDLPLLLDSSAQPITIDQPGNDGFLWRNFTSPKPWVSWQAADRAYGIGLASDQGLLAYQAWIGGPGAPYFHNVRSQIVFGLRSMSVVRGRSYLALGSFSTVSGLLEQVLAKRPPFGAVDAPAGKVLYPAGEPVMVSGWVLDSEPVGGVLAEVDGKAVASFPTDRDRADVCAVYPGYGGCPKAGFAGAIPTAGLSGCPHLLRLSSTDAQGNRTVLAERVLQPR